jgi:hypothetical protein
VGGKKERGVSGKKKEVEREKRRKKKRLRNRNRKIEKKNTKKKNSPHLDLPGLELPARRPVQRRHVHATRDEHVPARLGNGFQRPLDPVEDRAQRPGAQLDRQRRSGPRDDVADGETGSVLVALDGGRVPLKPDDLADEASGADADELVHRGAAHGVGDDDGAGDAADVAE